MPDEEDRALATCEYWDGRYGEVEDEKILHEWFRPFDALMPLFDTHLFNVTGRRAEENPFILHLGSGDSVRLPPSLSSLVLMLHLVCRLFRLSLPTEGIETNSASTFQAFSWRG
jgi:hypothetical protein